MSNNRRYFVYIITNKTNTVLYVGVTGNLGRRIYQHKNKHVAGFSSKYNLTELVYYEVHDDPKSAIKREKQLKNLVRRKKDKLIDDFNPEWQDLYKNVTD